MTQRYPTEISKEMKKKHENKKGSLLSHENKLKKIKQFIQKELFMDT